MQITQPEILKLEQDFPIKRKWAYFLSAASGPLPRATMESMNSFIEMLCLESSAKFPSWLSALDDTRSSAAKLLDCAPKNIAFIKNTSTGLSLAAEIIDWHEGDEIIIPRYEFPANVMPWLRLEEKGVRIRFLEASYPYARPLVKVEEVERLITKKTKALTCSFVQFDDGNRRDLASLGELCRKAGIVFIVDAIQGLGAFPLSCREIQPDFLASGSQKWLLSPPGCGLLYVHDRWLSGKSSANLGWLSVEDPFDLTIDSLGKASSKLLADARRFEEGTANFAGLKALGTSIDFLNEIAIENIAYRIKILTDRLCRGLVDRRCRLISPREDEHWSGIVSFEHPSLDAERLNSIFFSQGIVTSVRGPWLRVAVHYFNDEHEIDRLLQVLEKAVI